MTNFEIFIKTVNTLKSSQGFYSRLANDLTELSEEGRKQLETDLNNLPQWNDSVDCVLFLES